MTYRFGWIAIIGCLVLLLMVTFVPWYIWALIVAIVIGVIVLLRWRKHNDVFGDKL